MAAAAESQQNKEKKLCRICQRTDENCASRLVNYLSSAWVHPCKCSGSIKWAHRKCFMAWFGHASKCSICSHFYSYSPHLKPRWYLTQCQLLSYINMAVLSIFMLIYSLGFLTVHAFYPSTTIFCLIGTLILKELQLQMLLYDADDSKSVFEKSVDNYHDE